MNVIISGISGKMGACVFDEAKNKGLNVVCGIDKSINGNFDCPVYKNFDEINDFADVIIDFSSPDNLIPMLEYAEKNSTPLVICTTGYDENQEKIIYEFSKKLPIFKTSNTSRGVYLLIKLCEYLAENLADYEVEIIDCHHDKKKDAPSGTSYSIYNAISSIKKNSYAIFGRKGSTKRNKNEICLHSVRGGNVVGEHEVLFFGENDCISIKHTGYSKALFAEGAICAAKFIVGKSAGLYSMDDLIQS